MDVGLRAILAGFVEGRQQIADLNKEMDKTAESAKKVEGSGDVLGPLRNGAAQGILDFGELNTKIIAVGGAIGSVLGFAVTKLSASFLEGVNNVRQLGEEFSDLSQRLGIGVETLSSYQLLVKTNNMSMEGFSTSMQMFNRHIDEATKGTGKSAEAFERLGVNVQDSNGVMKSSDDLLKEVADKFANMEDGAGKTALAVDLFGRSGAQMIVMLNEGSAGFAKLTDEAHKAGLVMSKETAEAAKALNDNMEVLKAYGQGFWMSVASPVVEGLAKMTTAMRDARREGEGLLSSFHELLKAAYEWLFLPSPKSKKADNTSLINDLQAQIKDTEEKLNSGFYSGGTAAVQRGNLKRMYEQLQAAYAAQPAIDDALAIENGSFFGTPTRTPAPARSPAAGSTGSTSKGPSLESQLNEQVNIWKGMLEMGEITRQEYINNLQWLADKYEDNEKLRVRFGAMAAREIAKINEEASKDALAILKRTQDNERSEEQKAVREYVNGLKERMDAREVEVLKDKSLTHTARAEKLEALRDEIEAWRDLPGVMEMVRRLNKKIAEERVADEQETQNQIVQIWGQGRLDAVGIFKSFDKTVTEVLSNILHGHADLTGSISKLWKGLVDTGINELAKMGSKAILEPMFKPFKETLEPIFNDIGAMIRSVFNSAWAWVKSLFGSGDILQSFSGVAGGFGDMVKDAFSGAWGFIKGLFGGASTITEASLGELGINTASGATSILSGVSSGASLLSKSGGIFSNLFGSGSGLGATDIGVGVGTSGVAGGTGAGFFSSMLSNAGFLGPAAVIGGFILNDLFGKSELDPVAHQRYLDSRGITEAQFQQEQRDFYDSVTSGAFGFAGAQGGDMVVSTPTRFIAGELGVPERVTVTPMLGSPGSRGGDVHFHGPVIFDDYTMRKFKRSLGVPA